MKNRTREQRRRARLRRMYLALIATMVIGLVLLLAAAFRYGSYVTEQALSRKDAFQVTEPATYLPADFDEEAYREAGARYEQEKDPGFYALVYGQKKSADQRALIGAVLRQNQ